MLVVNDSLKMSKGKIAAQAGHATLACAMMLKEVNPKVSRPSHVVNKRDKACDALVAVLEMDSGRFCCYE